jgi:carbon-monoxide dehydrogenase small subunit
LLLTGTHLGCEHGVCGACTILLDDAPARACLAFAAGCEGARIRTIEGLEDDPVMVRLRAAFSREHALQCGYCTPGMLVIAYDIIARLPDADDDRIRLELAGNLCRCTGYNGIVKAIRAVLAERPDITITTPPALPQRRFAAPSIQMDGAGPPVTGQRGLSFEVGFDLPAEPVWQALRDPSLIASCIPGAVLTAIVGDRLSGEMTAALGPIRARFIGTATVAYDDARRSGRIAGEGRDRGSHTNLSGSAVFSLAPSGARSVLTLNIEYALQGPLAQLARGAIIEAVAAELAQAVGRNLQARLRGEDVAVADSGGLRFLAFALWRGLRRWMFAQRR